MGFNTSVLIRNSDLSEISADEDFGKHLARAIRSADTVEHILEKGGRPRTAVVDLAEIASCNREISTQYAIEVSLPVHADGEMVHDVCNGHLTSFRPYGHAGPYEGYVRLAEHLARHGYSVQDKATGGSWKPEKDAGHTYSSWMMGSGNNDLYDRGHTSLLVLNDGLSDIENDKTFGARLARDIQTYVLGEKSLHDMHADGQDLSRYRLADSVGAGSHANCVHIIGVTPENGYDAFVAGGNWGLMLRPYMDANGLTGDESSRNRRSDLKKDRLKEIADVLLHAGFHVRSPDQARAKKPVGWNAERWPIRPETGEETPAPGL